MRGPRRPALRRAESPPQAGCLPHRLGSFCNFWRRCGGWSAPERLIAGQLDEGVGSFTVDDEAVGQSVGAVRSRVVAGCSTVGPGRDPDAIDWRRYGTRAFLRRDSSGSSPGEDVGLGSETVGEPVDFLAFRRVAQTWAWLVAPLVFVLCMVGSMAGWMRPFHLSG